MNRTLAIFAAFILGAFLGSLLEDSRTRAQESGTNRIDLRQDIRVLRPEATPSVVRLKPYSAIQGSKTIFCEPKPPGEFWVITFADSRIQIAAAPVETNSPPP